MWIRFAMGRGSAPEVGPTNEVASSSDNSVYRRADSFRMAMDALRDKDNRISLSMGAVVIEAQVIDKYLTGSE